MFESKYCLHHAVNRKEAFQAASTTDCPYCGIDRLTALLSERDAEIGRLKLVEVVYRAIINNTHIAEDERLAKIIELTNQLTASQQECERLSSVLGLREYTNHIRKQAAREILEDAKMLLHYTECYAMNYKTSGAEQVAKEFRDKFGLEGRGMRCKRCHNEQDGKYCWYCKKWEWEG